MSAFRSAAQSLLVCVHGDLRNIQNRHVVVSMRQQVINEGGLPAAYVNDCGASGRDLFDESKRSLKVRAVPTHRVRCFLGVDPFPVGLSVHKSYLRSSSLFGLSLMI